MCRGRCKSRNLAKLRAALPNWVSLPKSAVLPYGVLNHVLAAPENEEAAGALKEMEASLADIGDEDPQPLLRRIRELVQNLCPPAAVLPALKSALQAHGASHADSEWWRALTAVWASSWNDRAFHACSRAGIQVRDVAMAVLVQHLVPAEYSAHAAPYRGS